MELQDRLDELEAQGLGAAAISYDSEEVLAAFAERKGIATLPLLSDDDSAVIRAFGIYNTVAEEGIGPRADDPDVKADVAQYVSVFGAIPMIVQRQKRRTDIWWNASRFEQLVVRCEIDLVGET